LNKLNRPGAEITIFNDVNETPSPPLSFEFVTESVYRDGVEKPDEEFIYGCQCKGRCAIMKAEGCSCTDDNHEAFGRHFAYKKNNVCFTF